MFHKNHLILLVLVLLCSFSAVAQKTKVLVIPFPENHFFSSISIQEVADANEGSELNDIPQFFIDNLISTLEDDHWKYDLIQIPANEYEAIRLFVEPIFKSKPIGHYGVDYSKIINNSSFQNICESYDIDRVLFLTHYTIQKKLLNSNKAIEGSFLIPWSSHAVQYEYYKTDGTLVALTDGINLKPDAPTIENYQQKGLNVLNLYRGYRMIIKDILKKEELHAKKQKPIFKIKKK